MKNQYLLVFIAFLVLGCQKKSKISVSQDFEKVAGWYPLQSLVKGKGHSGLYFSRTGEGTEFSQTFVSTLAEISSKPIRRIDMGAWIRMSDTTARARLVLSIESADSTVFWQGLDTQDASPKPGEWTRLFFTYDLPAGLQPGYSVKMFLWNVSKKEVDADDFDIHFYTF